MLPVSFGCEMIVVLGQYKLEGIDDSDLDV